MTMNDNDRAYANVVSDDKLSSFAFAHCVIVYPTTAAAHVCDEFFRVLHQAVERIFIFMI